jgi:hypothetical protein
MAGMTMSTACPAESGSAAAGSGSPAGASAAPGVSATAGVSAAAGPPFVAISASTAPTVTVSPSAAWIFATVPVAGAGTSASTLSVEISTIVSSAETGSPSRLCHSRMVPSETDSPIAGMTTSTVVLTAIPLGLRPYRPGRHAADARI